MKHWTDYAEYSWEFEAGKHLADMGCDGPFKGAIVSDSFEALFERDKFDVIARKAIRLANLLEKWKIDDQVDLLARKQHDYGHDNILKFGKLGVRVRLWDKIARYENLKARVGEVKNESTFDTLVDIVGYCCIYQMVVDGSFTSALEADMGDNV